MQIRGSSSTSSMTGNLAMICVSPKLQGMNKDDKNRKVDEVFSPVSRRQSRLVICLPETFANTPGRRLY